MRSVLSPEHIRQVLEERTAEQIASALRGPLQVRWDGGSGTPMGPHFKSDKERYGAVLDCVRDLEYLLPDMEDKARDIYGRIPWPMQSACNPHPFFPIPSFEALFGGICQKCKGRGVVGTITTIRCSACQGNGRRPPSL